MKTDTIIPDELLHFEVHPAAADAPWMVFIHGAGGSTRTWKKQVAFFKGKFNLLLTDLRDHGESKGMPENYAGFGFDVVASDVLHVMDSLEIREAHFVGVSMGSLIIRHLEQMAPDRVSSIVLAGGIFKMSRKLKVLVYSARLLTGILPFHTLYRIFALILLPKNNHVASRRVFIRESQKLRKKEVKKWLGLLKRLNTTLREMFNHRITAPCLIVMGAEDHVFLKPAREYVARYGNVLLETIEKCGHVCNIESPAEFNRRCLRFIQGLEGQKVKTM